ncbi:MULTISPECIES: hypothetical protein [Pedobacter]|uniref:Uncharacterized protein n=1 Tax=Pedobacter agri TaxID=454586 RepID=A0A9X3I918_9SPHI|nr:MULTISPECIES: hypothetical protein [Pedobacter]MCX3265346.1 hypothetical protein [Pedobacter agri]MDQ1138805.1 hypothetical protein [Pedobacter agri]
MSIYFQYPAIDEYPNFNYPLKIEVDDKNISVDEDKLNQEHIAALKDFLALKPV